MSGVNKVKDDIISIVQNTNDLEMLDKVRSALYSKSLTSKIANAFSDRETTVHHHLDHIANTIMNLKGLDIEEKIKFAEGLKHGYIDIEKLVSGKRVSFKGLIKAPKDLYHFALAVFNELIRYKPNSKGPGEFALAVMSPDIKIDGAGDLKIGNDIIEVKASTVSGGGSLGHDSLSYEKLPNLFKRYGITGGGKKGNTLSLSNFVDILNRGDNELLRDENNLQSFAKKLWRGIFKNYKKINLDDLIAATVGKNRKDIDREFVIAAYKAYQGGSDDAKLQKFQKVMLINQKNQEFQVFNDPKELAKNIKAVDATLLGDQMSRALAPRVNLSSQPVIKPMTIKQTPTVSPNLDQWIEQAVDYFIYTNKEDYELKDQLKTLVAGYITQGIRDYKKIEPLLQAEVDNIRKYNDPNPQEEPTQQQPPVNNTASPAQQQPPVNNTASPVSKSELREALKLVDRLICKYF
jgi:hypothetical protein